LNQLIKHCCNISFYLLLFGVVTPPAYAGNVIIYYANETHLNEEATENYKVLSTWLNDDSEPLGPKIAGQIASDLEAFQKAVETEIDSIKKTAKNSNILIFTNNLSTKGKSLIFSQKEAQWSEASFSVPEVKNYILSSHPNSQKQVFENALMFAAKMFPPAENNFSLITKSHGSELFIMVPRITIKHGDFDRARFLDVVHGRTKVDGVPPWMEGIGITRAEYFDSIQKVGEKTGMTFDLIFTESCKSRIGIGSIGKLPNNISMLISPADNLEYSTINYERIFSEDDQPSVLLGRYLLETFPKDVALGVKESGNFKKAFPYWIPLIILILVWSGTKIWKGKADG
jgi:hypothetical protein